MADRLIEYRREFFVSAMALFGSAACANKAPELAPHSGRDMDAEDLVHYIPVFWTGSAEAQIRIDFFWSPTCKPSADLYAQIFRPHFRNPTPRIAVFFHALPRHFGDAVLIAGLRAQGTRSFAQNSIQVLAENQRRATPLSSQAQLRARGLDNWLQADQPTRQAVRIRANTMIAQYAYQKRVLEVFDFKETPQIVVNGYSIHPPTQENITDTIGRIAARQ